VKIYVAEVEVLMKKERQGETSKTIKIDGFLSLLPLEWLCTFFVGVFLISPC
jgi:hypothetical protein